MSNYKTASDLETASDRFNAIVLALRRIDDMENRIQEENTAIYGCIREYISGADDYHSAANDLYWLLEDRAKKVRDTQHRGYEFWSDLVSLCGSCHGKFYEVNNG